MEHEDKDFLTEWNGSDKIEEEKKCKDCKCKKCKCVKEELLNE